MATKRKRPYSVAPIDSALRAAALRAIQAYGETGSMRAVPTPPLFLEESVPTMMHTLSGLIEASEKGELSLSRQKDLVALLKQTVKDYPVKTAR